MGANNGEQDCMTAVYSPFVTPLYSDKSDPWHTQVYFSMYNLSILQLLLSTKKAFQILSTLVNIVEHGEHGVQCVPHVPVLSMLSRFLPQA